MPSLDVTIGRGNGGFSNRRRREVPASAGESDLGGHGERVDYESGAEDDRFEGMIRRGENGGLDDDVNEKVHRAQERLLHLRQEAEQLEREQQELTELKQRQEQFVRGREEMSEKLHRAVVTLERETYEAQKRIEEFLRAKDSFARHLGVIEDLNPEKWPKAEIKANLGRALSAIEDAELDYGKSMVRINALLGGDSSPLAQISGSGVPRDFRFWVRAGVGLSIPFAALTALILGAAALIF
ncbi:MAG: hypothetical protein R3F11_18085 [Verrucomicrobiales bacterium]